MLDNFSRLLHLHKHANLLNDTLSMSKEEGDEMLNDFIGLDV